MDSNKNADSNISGSQRRNAADKAGTFSGNHRSYNKKNRQRHFGPATDASSAPRTAPVSDASSASVNTGANQPSVPGNNVLKPSRAPILNQSGTAQRNVNPPPKIPSAAPSQSQRPATQQAANQPNVSNRNLNQNQPSVQRQTSSQKPFVQQTTQRPVHQHSSQQPQTAPQSQQPRMNQPARKWGNRSIKIEETYEEIKKDNERIEKEIWLEIAEIHNAKLD